MIRFLRLRMAIRERDRRRKARLDRERERVRKQVWDAYIHAPTYREAREWLKLIVIHRL